MSYQQKHSIQPKTDYGHHRAALGNITGLLGSGTGAASGDYRNIVSDGLIGQTITEHNNAAQAGRGIAIPLLGALYCAFDRGCASVTETFIGMMAEQRRQAQEEHDAIFASIQNAQKGDKKAQPKPQQEGSRAATGAPMPPDDEDEEKNKSSIDKIVKDKNGNFVGNVNKGATENIRTVSQQEFQQIKNNLLKNAKEVGKYSNGRGTWYQLPNGDRFGIRGSSRHGETLDFDVKGLPRDFKIHQK